MKSRTRQASKSKASAQVYDADVLHLLGVLARVTRRIVDEENAKTKQEHKP